MKNSSKKFSRRDLLRMAGVTTAGIIIASCTPAAQPAASPTKAAENVQPTAQPTAQPPEATNTPAPTAQPPAAAKTKLTFWSHDNVSWVASNKNTVAKFMEKYPNYEVEYTPFSYGDLQQKIQTAIPIGQGCDILENWGDEMFGMINSGLIAPMDDTLATSIKNNFWEGSYTSLLHSGKLYGFCQEIAFDNGLLINKKDYAAANLTKYPETTAELFEQAKALTQVDAQGVITRAGLGWMYHDQTLANFCEGVVELGGNYWNSNQTQVTFQTPEAAAVLNTMFDMVNGQKISSVEIDSGTREDLLYQDKVALQKIGPWIMPTSQANYPDVEVDWIVGPGFTGKPRQAVNTGGWSIFVTTQSAGKPGIWDFVGFKASEDVQRDFISRTGLVPAMKVLKDDPVVIEKQPQLKNVMSLVGKTFSMGPVFNASKFTLAVYNNFIPFLNKEKDVTAALADAEKEINTMLAEANK